MKKPVVESIEVGTPGLEVAVSRHLKHRCPFRDEEDNGWVAIKWTVVTHSIEAHSLADYLDGFAGVVISHEDLTRRIRDDIAAISGVTHVETSSTWNTAGMEVACSTSRTRAPTT